MQKSGCNPFLVPNIYIVLTKKLHFLELWIRHSSSMTSHNLWHGSRESAFSPGGNAHGHPYTSPACATMIWWLGQVYGTVLLGTVEPTPRSVSMDLFQHDG